MTLAQEIEKFNIEAAKGTPPEVAEAFQTSIQNWISNHIEKDALKEGDKIPSFQLNDANGKLVSSDTLLKQGPIVISFYRGGWCPYCNLELNALQKHIAEIKKANGTLVAISPELPDNSLTTIEKNKIAFPVLTDRNLQVAKQFGIAIQLPEIIKDMTKNVFGLDLTKINGADTFDLPIPATYVVDSDHIVRYAYVNPNFMQRSEPTKIVEALINLN